MAGDVTLIDLRMQLNKSDQAQIEAAFKRVNGGIAQSEKEIEAMARASKQAAAELAQLSKRDRQILNVAEAFKAASASGENVSGASEKAARALDKLGATSAEIDKVGNSLEFSVAQARQLDSALDTINRNERFDDITRQTALSGDFESAGRTAGGALSAFGAQSAGQGVSLASEIPALVEAIPRAKVAFEGLGPAAKAAASEIGFKGAGLVGGMIALAAVTALAQKEFQDAAKETRSTIDAQKSAFELIRTGSVDAVLERKNALQEQLNLQRDYLSAIEKDYDSLIAKTEDKIGGALTDVIEFTSTNVGIGSGALGEYNKQIEDQRNIVNGLSSEFNILNNALDSNALAADIAKQAELELADARHAAATSGLINIIREQARLESEIQREVADGDKPAIQERRSGFESEIEDLLEANQKLALSSAFASEEARIAFQAEIDANTLRAENIKKFLLPVLDDADAQILGLSNTFSGATLSFGDMVDALREQAAIGRDITDAENALADARQKGADRIENIERKLAEKREDLIIGVERKLADAVSNAANKREDELIKFQDKSADIERDLARERLKIQREFQRDSKQAIGDRDVLGFSDATRDKNEGLADAKESADEQNEELKINYDRQLATITRGLARQGETIQKGYNRQSEDAQRQANRQLALEQERANAEIRLRQQALTAQQQQLGSFARGGVTQLNSFANAGLTAINAFAQGAVAQLNAMNGAFAGAGGASNVAGAIRGSGGVTPAQVEDIAANVLIQAMGGR